jgi:hypothetical protein
MLTVIAAIVGVATQTNDPALFLLMPPAATILGWVYLTNDHKVTAIGTYIRADLARRLSDHLEGRPIVFDWETANRTDRTRQSRRRHQLVVDLTAFALAPLASVTAYIQLGPLVPAALTAAVIDAMFVAAIAAQFIKYYRGA